MHDEGPNEGIRPEVVVDRSGAIPVIRLVGEHDMSTAPEVRAAIEELGGLGESVVLSLAETTFIDSTVIHALCTGDRRLKAEGRRLVLHVVTGTPVARTLDLSGLNGSPACSQTLEDALRLASA